MKKFFCFLLLCVLLFSTSFPGESQALQIPFGFQSLGLSGKLLAFNPGWASSVQQINCVRRGQVISGTDNIALCSHCNEIYVLPYNYTPSFVNGVSCTSDTRALSGYARCEQKFLNESILYNSGTDASPRYMQKTISVPSSCEVVVINGSALSNLVAN